ncbi:MAG: argininosuccinate synthase [Candidatus Hecatellales archaeon]|nr:MAG: argininosuccinate synthase [Candidatus Hecatellales archaeon]
MEKVVLAYSGGLDTSVMVRWLKEKYGFEVVTVIVDVGQQEDLKAIEEKAKLVGAIKHYTIDAKKEFIENFVFPAIKANALYEGKYPLSSALSRPLIAKKLVEIARKEEASAVAHGCTGRGNDQVRFEVTIEALAPDLKIIAPVREWKLTREEEVEYAKKYGIHITPKKHPYSIDQNLWGRSIECGPLDNPNQEPPKDVFEWTANPEEAPDKPEYVTVRFEEGIPTAINGENMDGVELISSLNKIAGKHGVGRIDHVEDRVVGLKSREVYECPAAICLIEAHKDLEKLVLTRHELMFKEWVDLYWGWLVYSGLWVEPLREDLEAFIEKTQERVSGEVRLKLYRGNVMVVGRSSPFSLHLEPEYDQSIASGFIRLWGLQTKSFHLKSKRER